MITGLRAEEYIQLPGVLRFIRRVAADLDRGKSAIVVFPDSVVESGLADAVLQDLAREGTSVAFCHESAEPFPSRVLATFGADPVREPAFAEWDTLINWDAWHGSWVLIPAWQHADIGEIVDRWPPQLNACGLPLEDRPKLVIAARLADLARKKIAHVDRNGVAVHWWWGVVDRLDTELRLSAKSDAGLNPVDAAVIVEVAAWDIGCIDFLLAEWDRTVSSLPGVLSQYRQREAACDFSVAQGNHRGVTSPPDDLEQHWRDGMVDRWGHAIRRAVRAMSEADLAQRIWMAHNRVLTQYVDEERAEYEQMIRGKASQSALKDLQIRDDDIIEIGSLAWLVSTRRVDIGRDDRERLTAFRDLRNELAHRRFVGDELMRRIRGYLGF